MSRMDQNNPREQRKESLRRPKNEGVGYWSKCDRRLGMMDGRKRVDMDGIARDDGSNSQVRMNYDEGGILVREPYSHYHATTYSH